MAAVNLTPLGFCFVGEGFISSRANAPQSADRHLEAAGRAVGNSGFRIASSERGAQGIGGVAVGGDSRIIDVYIDSAD